MPPKDRSSCLVCRLRKKKCGGPARPEQKKTGACKDCKRLNIDYLHGYGLPVPRELRDKRVIQLIKQHTKCLANRAGPPLQLRQYITTPLPNNVASPTGDANNVETDPNYPVITPNTLQVGSHSFDTHTQHREVTTSGPFFTTLPAFQMPVVNSDYGQYVPPNGVLASTNPDATKISSVSVRDAAHPPSAHPPIAEDISFHQTQRPLSDYSVGSYAPDGVIIYNGPDDFANCFTSREAQPVCNFPESGPPPFDVSSTHHTTADSQNLWFDDYDPRSVTGRQDAQTLDTLGSGLERSFSEDLWRLLEQP